MQEIQTQADHEAQIAHAKENDQKADSQARDKSVSHPRRGQDTNSKQNQDIQLRS